MRSLSFLFAALLGVVLALMAPALAGSHPQAGQPDATALGWATEAVAPESLAPATVAPEVVAPEAVTAEVDALSEDALIDEPMSIEQISRSVLDTLNALSDPA